MDDNHTVVPEERGSKQVDPVQKDHSDCLPLIPAPSFLRPFLCRKTRLACALYSITFALLIFWAIPQLLGSDRLLLFIQNAAVEKLSVSITAEKVTFSLAQGPGLSLKGVTVLDRESGKSVATAKQVFITPDIWNSLKGNISLSNLVLIEPAIRLIRSEEGVWNIGRLISHGKSGNPASAMPSILKIFQGEISIEDRYVADKPVMTKIKNISVNIENNAGFAPSPMIAKGIIINNRKISTEHIASFLSPDKQRYSTFSMDGTIRPVADSKMNNDTFTGKIELNNFDIRKYKPYLSGIIDTDKTSGNVSLSLYISTENKKIVATGRVDLREIKTTSPNNLIREIGESPVKITFTVSTQGENLQIDKISATSREITVLANGKIEKIYDTDPLIDLTLKTNDIRVSYLKKFILQANIPRFIKKFIQDNLYHGRIAVSNLALKSTFSDLVERIDKNDFSFLNVKLHASDWRIGFKNLSYALENTGAEIEFSDNQIRLKNITSFYGDSSIFDSSGVLKNIFSEPVIDVQINADLDLADAKELMIARINSEMVRDRLLEIESVEGTLKSSLAIHATPGDSTDNLHVKGKVTFADISMKHKKSAIAITGLTGSVTSDLHNVTFNKIKWLVGESPCTLEGEISNAFGKKAALDMHLTSEIGMSDLKKFPYAEKIKNAKGFASIDVDLLGPIENLKAKGMIDLTNAAYSVATVIEKEKGISANLLFSGSVSDTDRLKVESFTAVAGDSRIEVSGRVDDFLKGNGIDLVIKADKAKVNDFDQFFAFLDDVDSNGSASGMITVKQDKDDNLVFDGVVSIVNADFRIPVLDDNFSRTNGTIRLVGDKLFLERVTGWFGTGKFVMTGFGKLGAKPEFTLNVEADTIHLDELFGDALPEPEDLNETDDDKNYLDCPWHINIKSDRGRLGILRYSDLSGRIEYADDRFDLRPFTFQAHGGKFDYSGSITLLDEPDGSIALKTETEASITDLDMKRFLGEAVQSEKAISGLFDLRGRFNATGKNWQEIERDMDGNFIITSKKGVINRFNVLSKIFSLLNFSQYFRLKTPDLDVNGMPFDAINASFIMHKGVAETEDMLVDSEAIRLSAIGSYDLPKNSVKMTVGAAPFVMIDRVISSIPVAGYVLAGENGSFLTTSFKVEGSLADPDVRIIPIESLAKGILGTLERLLTLPIKAAEQLKENKNSTRDGK